MAHPAINVTMHNITNGSNATNISLMHLFGPDHRTLGAVSLDIGHGLTAFMFLCTSMVQFMGSGVGFLYAGMTQSKSVIQLIMQSFICLSLVFTIWCIVGFSIAFGLPMMSIGPYHIFASPVTFFMLEGVKIYEPLQRAGAVVATGFPGMLFMAFQGMFAVVAPALISGALVDRFRFRPYLIFVSVWSCAVYSPLSFWNWGGGWMYQIGAWDFAGGMVVHEASGFSALAALLILGRRPRAPSLKDSPHSIPMAVMGTGIVWFAWFGFNGGSALTIGGLATVAFVNTQVCPAMSLMTWVAMDWVRKGKPSIIGAICGALTGLVIITPFSGFCQPQMAALAGVIGAVAVWFANEWMIHKTQLDDACCTIPIHGVGGFLGSCFVGIFSDPPECADRATAPDWCSNPGTCTRSMKQFLIQFVCSCFAAIYAFVVTTIIVRAMTVSGVKKIRTYEDQFACQDYQEFGEIYFRQPEPVGAYRYVAHPEAALHLMNVEARYSTLQDNSGSEDEEGSTSAL
eukprot:TRINITY_DN4258_c2_g1_i1.p1 TRINITY_DN4258_c2_g1~~TRINITY_DN4258_c2_g1_i1.p1  ORF type:complete len:513 (-),score=61.49 TRINITY_DN4258_c2_g1_i1:167-1705(-)